VETDDEGSMKDATPAHYDEEEETEGEEEPATRDRRLSSRVWGSAEKERKMSFGARAEVRRSSLRLAEAVTGLKASNRDVQTRLETAESAREDVDAALTDSLARQEFHHGETARRMSKQASNFLELDSYEGGESEEASEAHKIAAAQFRRASFKKAAAENLRAEIEGRLIKQAQAEDAELLRLLDRSAEEAAKRLEEAEVELRRAAEAESHAKAEEDARGAAIAAAQQAARDAANAEVLKYNAKARSLKAAGGESTTMTIRSEWVPAHAGGRLGEAVGELTEEGRVDDEERRYDHVHEGAAFFANRMFRLKLLGKGRTQYVTYELSARFLHECEAPMRLLLTPSGWGSGVEETIGGDGLMRRSRRVSAVSHVDTPLGSESGDTRPEPAAGVVVLRAGVVDVLPSSLEKRASMIRDGPFQQIEKGTTKVVTKKKLALPTSINSYGDESPAHLLVPCTNRTGILGTFTLRVTSDEPFELTGPLLAFGVPPMHFEPENLPTLSELSITNGFRNNAATSDPIEARASEAWEAVMRKFADEAADSSAGGNGVGDGVAIGGGREELQEENGQGPGGKGQGLDARGQVPRQNSFDFAMASKRSLEEASKRAAIETALMAEAARFDAITERSVRSHSLRLEREEELRRKRASFKGQIILLKQAIRPAKEEELVEMTAAQQLAAAQAELSQVRLMLGALTFYGQLRKLDSLSLESACSISHPAFAKPNARIIYNVFEVLRQYDKIKLVVHARAPSFFKSDEQELAARLVQGHRDVPVPKNLGNLCAILGMDFRTQALEATEELARRRGAAVVNALVEHELPPERLLASWEGFGETASVEMAFVADSNCEEQPLPLNGLRRLAIYGGTYE